ncbi:MAG TPA: CPBP family intramembrane glutamic endopeptidase [Longimicrobiales bacterium]|nr:CPBP family intramembrane glutamic endopeptidase [Longimicrobiales bacterium]
MLGGRLRRHDIGLDGSRIAPAFLTTAGLWAAAQIVLATAAWLETNDVALASTWQERGDGVQSLGFLAGMLLGTVLYEEIIYRGVLLPQCYLILRGNRILRLAGALLVSQTLFACLHFPSLVIWYDLDAAELLARLIYLFGAGCFFALLYFRTENLLAVVGIHSLLNRPTSLVESPLNAVAVLLALSVVLGFVWPVVNGGSLRFRLPEIRLRPGGGGTRPKGSDESAQGEVTASAGAPPGRGLAQGGHGRG